MKIDNYKNYFLRSERNSIVKCLESFNYEYKNFPIESHLIQTQRICSIRKEDYLIILEFMSVNGYVEIKEGSITSKENSNSPNIFGLFSNYYINNLLSHEELRNELFGFKDFRVLNNDLVIDISTVSIDFRKFYIGLKNLGIVKNHKSNNMLKIVSSFDIADTIYEKSLRTISKKEFDNIQKQKAIKGELAEMFVLNHEIKKLKDLSLEPVKISEISVGAGYDIKSFDLNGNKLYIEVKSISNGDKFYLSENEIKVSKLFKENYKIYCVRFKDGFPTNIEVIISNPAKTIFIDQKFDSDRSGDYIVYI
jgi:hypothetical protein